MKNSSLLVQQLDFEQNFLFFFFFFLESSSSSVSNDCVLNVFVFRFNKILQRSVAVIILIKINN